MEIVVEKTGDMKIPHYIFLSGSVWIGCEFSPECGEFSGRGDGSGWHRPLENHAIRSARPKGLGNFMISDIG